MNNQDAGSYTSDQQKLLRIKAVDIVFNEGFTQRAAAKTLGVSRQHVVKWRKAFEHNEVRYYFGLADGWRVPDALGHDPIVPYRTCV